MIETYYGLGTLGTASAFFASLAIGFFFGLILERAGFGSSRRLSGIFYFRDMAVLKVMFTALITAMIGLAVIEGLGLIDMSTQIYHMISYYGTYQFAGLLFGVGFVMSGWCPGTGAVGLASGKIDALVFLVGVLIGSIVFNELFPVIKPLYTWGQSTQENFGQMGLAFVYTSLGMSKPFFALFFTVMAVACFWGAERVEQVKVGGGVYFKSPFLKALSIGFVIFAGTLFIFPGPGAVTGKTASAASVSDIRQSEKALLVAVESAEDHMEPEELADLLTGGNTDIAVIDVRPSNEYDKFHIRGAVNVQLPDLPEFVETIKNKSMIVLYSNGMTHPAQARDSLFRLGYRNVYMLTDGLNGFVEKCLKPVSLRGEPLSAEDTVKIAGWRDYFYGREAQTADAEPTSGTDTLPGLVDTEWLALNLGRKDVKVIDSRDQPEYNKNHIIGSLSISPESFRGSVGGVPSMLVPAESIAQTFSLMGLGPKDTVIIVYGGDRVRDATLIGMAFERLGHEKYGILDGGFDKWMSEKKDVSTDLPSVSPSVYPVSKGPDRFTVDYKSVLSHVQNKTAWILDVRPEDYFTGKKSDEARAGHIPGALNRPFTNDLYKTDTFGGLKPVSELTPAYATLIPSKDTGVVVHCRTGHQASQTWFVMKHLLGYQNVYWYDAGWTEWAARKELPIE